MRMSPADRRKAGYYLLGNTYQHRISSICIRHRQPPLHRHRRRHVQTEEAALILPLLCSRPRSGRRQAWTQDWAPVAPSSPPWHSWDLVFYSRVPRWLGGPPGPSFPRVSAVASNALAHAHLPSEGTPPAWVRQLACRRGPEGGSPALAMTGVTGWGREETAARTFLKGSEEEAEPRLLWKC